MTEEEPFYAKGQLLAHSSGRGGDTASAPYSARDGFTPKLLSPLEETMLHNLAETLSHLPSILFSLVQ